MGGRLTVSSREDYGSTFTFILPYKVSNESDSSDDQDELSDMANHDAVSDDATESYFEFQPRTLGSLFNSNGSSRTPNLLTHTIGFTSSHKLNGLPVNSYAFPSGNCIPKETVSVEETSSEPEEVSTSHSSDPDKEENGVFEGKRCQDNTKDQLQNAGTDPPTHNAEASRESLDVAPSTSKSQATCQRQDKSDVRSSEQISRNVSVEVPSSTLEPRILLVEDNKINVMVTQSMMKRLGHSIDVVNNGVEAVKAIQRRSYGLVLMVISIILACLVIFSYNNNNDYLNQTLHFTFKNRKS